MIVNENNIQIVIGKIKNFISKKSRTIITYGKYVDETFSEDSSSSYNETINDNIDIFNYRDRKIILFADYKGDTDTGISFVIPLGTTILFKDDAMYVKYSWADTCGGYLNEFKLID
jgi:hypothetical protein